MIKYGKLFTNRPFVNFNQDLRNLAKVSISRHPNLCYKIDLQYFRSTKIDIIDGGYLFLSGDIIIKENQDIRDVILRNDKNIVIYNSNIYIKDSHNELILPHNIIGMPPVDELIKSLKLYL